MQVTILAVVGEELGAIISVWWSMVYFWSGVSVHKYRILYR